jgi:hypothetical protein
MTNKLFFSVISLSLFLAGCGKNHTSFYEDTDNKGLGIFSNKGNNVMTALVNEIPWKTKDRIEDGRTYKIDYEIYLKKQKTNTAKDTLILSWLGPYINSFTYNYINLSIAVDSNFTYKDFKTSFNGKRLLIDSCINGYFTSNFNNIRAKGNGVIFFQTAVINTNSITANDNKLAGLFNTKIGTTIINDGRFDHELNGLTINF